MKITAVCVLLCLLHGCASNAWKRVSFVGRRAPPSSPDAHSNNNSKNDPHPEPPIRHRRQLKPIAQELVAGGASRAIAQMVLYPVDALRTLAQTRDGRSLADVGWSALVRGSFMTSSFALWMGAIQFSIFGACREKCGPFFASALGAAGSCLVSVPQEVIKQRLVTGIYPSFRAAVTSIFQEEGVLGFYSAWKPTMVRNVPFVVVTMTSMDVMKSYFLRRQQERHKDRDVRHLTVLENSMFGISAALVAAIVTQPVDVIKTRMMTQAASTQVPYTSALDCLWSILKTEGPGTLYAGFYQRSTYISLLWGLTFALNGKFLSAMRKPE